MSFALAKNYGSFLPRFYRLSFVAVLSNMMIPLAGLCDTAFLGHLKNIQPLAGVILASILFDYLYRILKFLRNSTNGMTAQAVGENDSKGVILALLRSGLIAVAIAFMLEGYFIGLKEGAVLRKASLTAFIVVFLPLVIVASYRNSVSLLWLSLTSYMLTLIIVLSSQIFATQKKLLQDSFELSETR